MDQDTGQDLDPSLLETHGSRRESPESLVMTLGGSDPGHGPQVSTEDGSEVDLSPEEGVVMTKVAVSRERRPPMSVRSSNSEIQTSTSLRTMSTSLAPPTRVWWTVDVR